MKALIIGHRGYIGPVLAEHFILSKQNIQISGIDVGWFNDCDVQDYPDHFFKSQINKDVRDLQQEDFLGFDTVIYLAAVSNDPMGKSFEAPTEEINCIEAHRAAELSKLAGVKSFVFASSCSIYGAGGDGLKKEIDQLNPLTAYAVSKVNAEAKLEELSSELFKITCLRFSTACGPSPMLRLDLVLNDFVASAITDNLINVLSDGSPWRPLIDVRDMARAIEWACFRLGEDFVSVNVGSNSWTFQIGQLAQKVSQVLGDVQVHINDKAEPDKRSYAVDFSYFQMLAPEHQPAIKFEDTVRELATLIRKSNKIDSSFRSSNLIRHNKLRLSINSRLLDDNLRRLND